MGAAYFIDPTKNATAYQIVLLGAASFLIVEIGVLLSSTGHLRALVYRKSTQIDNLIAQGNLQRDFMDHLMRLFSFSDGHAHAAAKHLVNDFVADIDLTATSVAVKGETLAYKLYQQFWRELVEAQKNHHASHQRNISVYISQAAPSTLSDSEEFGTLRDLQADFHNLHGSIYRVVQHTRDSNDTPEQFNKFIGDLRGENIVNAYYLDVSKNPVKATLKHDHNYLLATFDGIPYALVWDIEVYNGDATIRGCKIEFGVAAFQVHREEWHRLVRLFDTTPLDADPTKRGLAALAIRPNDDDKRKMLALS